MNSAKAICLAIIFGLICTAAPHAHAAEVTYTLENVILDDGSAPMSGTFSWIYDIGDFENGVGQFSFLDIPYTGHDHTDLNSVIDIGSSIEITLAGSVHDDGVDITLFLLQPLTPTTSSSVDLVRSKYEIGGNGFHDGAFLSGDIVPSAATDVASGTVAAPAITLTTYPNPFRTTTDIRFALPERADASIEIFDMSGRLVRTLAGGSFQAGSLVVTWDGNNDGGRRVSAGVYFTRARAGDYTMTQRMTLLR